MPQLSKHMMRFDIIKPQDAYIVPGLGNIFNIMRQLLDVKGV